MKLTVDHPMEYLVSWRRELKRVNKATPSEQYEKELKEVGDIIVAKRTANAANTRVIKQYRKNVSELEKLRRQIIRAEKYIDDNKQNYEDTLIRIQEIKDREDILSTEISTQAAEYTVEKRETLSIVLK